ncbi:MAG: Hsp20/alpha crystallin family protein [Acidobacteriota bacterium]
MAIVRWEPFREMATIQDRVNRLFSEFYRGSDDDVLRRGSWIPPVDIYDTGNHELIIKAELPDMGKDDIEITVDNDTLTLKGEKKMDGAIKDDQCRRIERAYGMFSRTFSLPPTVDAAKVKADYKNGVLTLTLPLKEEARPKQIPVQVQG